MNVHLKTTIIDYLYYSLLLRQLWHNYMFIICLDNTIQIFHLFQSTNYHTHEFAFASSIQNLSYYNMACIQKLTNKPLALFHKFGNQCTPRLPNSHQNYYPNPFSTPFPPLPTTNLDSPPPLHPKPPITPTISPINRCPCPTKLHKTMT